MVTAKDYEIKVGDNFDVKSDYTGFTIQDDSKVKVTFQEAKDTDGNDFSTDYANSYKAVYYVEPQTTDHPTYQINRKIVVKEADQQKDSQSESSSDQDAGSSDKTETEDSEADSSTEETDAADTESKTELTEKEFDAEIEATEDQETVDPETGITLSEVMQEAVDQEVALADLEAGESITFDMPMMLASGETGTKSVTVTAGSWYYYADYGLGSYLTCPYYVKWGSINATAYCVEPSKKGPGNGTYTIQKLADGKTLAKVCYYGTKDIQTKDGKVIVKADTLLQEMTSDEKGQAACTLDLPLGSYYVKELKAPDGFVSSDEVLRFDASYQGQDVQTVTLKSVKKNQPTTVEITKSDATTGVELDGAYLKVTDKDGNVVDSWTSSKDAPHVIKYLKVGENYTLHEEFAPHGYLVANDVTFTVKDTGEVQKVEMKDEVPVGELIINKKGEFLDSVTLADKVKGVVEHIFNYVTGKLTDVTFEVYAEEDIKAADGVSDDYYKKDELIATIKTDETGIAKLENLPLGKYYVKETGTAYGHVLDGEIRHVDLTYVDQNTPVVVYDKDWQNNRQRVEVNVLKKEKDSDRTLEGAIFGLFAKEDIKSETTGKVLIEADEIIELKSTDEEGKITFVADLPIGATYYVKELYAPDGFVTNDEVKEFTFEYAGEDQPTVTYDFTFDNQPTVVEFTKSSLTTGKELPGCKLKVVDADGNIVDEWTSGKEAHVIRELTVGKEYTLVETKPADGYVTAESVKFTIKDTADVQKVEMKDDVTKVKISKQDIAGKELPGAKLTILDQDGKVVESWTSTEKAHYIEMLPIGKYTLREETAPDGYLVAKDVEFEVKDTCEVQHVTMVDEKKPAEKTPEGGKPVSDSPKTGDNTNLWLWFMLLGIGATGTGALAFMRKKKH